MFEKKAPVVAEPPRWLEVAYGELAAGVSEVAGKADNPRILEYFKHAPMTGEIHDETPWCSAFVNFCMDSVGLKGTRRPNARSWLLWGRGIIVPRLGAVTVFNRPEGGPGSGHVAFYISQDTRMIRVLGGNQKNRVCIADYPRDRLLGFRWAV